ncbi:hypothetical protein J2S43_002215 [Catenuloplanes nepalensis]|uniref:Replication initiation protein n=1 Tax=Catenuloplanes nepalensis TaxID=587533 RepID=A0ABT9MQK2_9ACTN|nr:replication initiator [Catenuloplanes nepalensis]MDP9793703.1 hypothetical protein [Catenuloplanes nepalensis]
MMSATPDHAEAGWLVRLAESADLQHRVGACQHPITVTGRVVLVERGTGRILDDPDTRSSVVLRCRSRRVSVCPPCAALYKLDAYHLIAAGLHGGKDTPAGVAGRPRLFITLTAPSFGPVHLGPDRHGQPRACHPRARRVSVRRGCGRWHPAGDPLIGTSLDPGGYDYTGQVLFNAHTGRLWARFVQQSRRALVTTAGLPRDVAASQVRMVFAKVAEFQARGVVHLHAVVRLDGPDGPASPPPLWATVTVLERALRIAVRRVMVGVPGGRRVAARSLRWGRQFDIRPIAVDGGLSEIVVARYVAKYATKAAEVAGIDLGPIFCRVCDGHGAHPVRDRGAGRLLCRRCSGTGRRPGVDLRELGDHARRLVETCWWLGGQPAFASLRLRRHAHTFGFRGHFATTSRAYSTTFTALRAERRHWTHGQRAAGLGLDPAAVLVVGDWRYTGRGAKAGAA